MKFLLDLLFPKFCISCKRIGRYICSSCFQSFVFQKMQRCVVCDITSPDGITHPQCRKASVIGGVYNLLEYKGITKVFIKNIKYKRMFSILDDFFSLLPTDIKKNIIDILNSYNIDYIQPIPLHSQRKRIRGFNQAEYIAYHISLLTHIPVVSILERKINTSPQAYIHKKEQRVHNMKGAFCYKGNFLYKGKTILLIDDLFTTGSTSKEAANELKINGAAAVFVFTLAHG